MTQEELVRELAECAGLSLNDSRNALSCLETIIIGGLKRVGQVRTSLGTFKVAQIKARAGRIPRTGERIEISARNVVRFSPSLRMKRAMNQ